MRHQSKTNTKAIILAAGMSTRLRAMTEDLPKCLLSLNEDTILDYQIQSLAQLAIRHLFIVAGYKRALIERHVASVRSTIPITIVHNELFKETDNAYSLSLALERVDTDNDTIVVLDGDILFDFELLRTLVQSPYDNICMVDNTKTIEPEDCKVAVNSGTAMSIGKAVPGNVVYTSMIKLGNGLLVELQRELKAPRTAREWYSEGLNRLLTRYPSTMRVLYTNGRLRCEIDTYEDLVNARELYQRLKSMKRYHEL
jgi:choline kinase